jgi:hypothetical protein
VRYLPSSRYLRAQRLASIHSARRLRLLALQVRLGLTARYSSAPHWLRARLVLQQALRSAMGAERRRRQGLPVLELQGLAPDGAGFKCKDGVASLFLLVTSEGSFTARISMYGGNGPAALGLAGAGSGSGPDGAGAARMMAVPLFAGAAACCVGRPGVRTYRHLR